MEKYNTEKEVWKDIKGYEGYYQVSNHGKVRSKDRTVAHKAGSSRFVPGIMRKTPLDKDGYASIRLSKDGKTRTFQVHRLVAEAFVPNPDKKPHINHIDEIKDNNYYKNLEWVTIQENSMHGSRIERIQKTKAKQGREVTVIDKKKNKTFAFVSIRQTSIRLGISTYSIYNNLNTDKLINGRYKIKRLG